jgi:hypothetical protein
VNKNIDYSDKFYILGAPVFSEKTLLGYVEPNYSSMCDTLNYFRRFHHAMLDKDSNIHIFY